MANYKLLIVRKKIALNFIKRFIKKNEYSPSLQEIANYSGITRPRAHQIVKELIADGKLKKAKGKQRGLTLIK